ncbi:hypothetical protein D3C75_847230 [compost metagenome]
MAALHGMAQGQGDVLVDVVAGGLQMLAQVGLLAGQFALVVEDFADPALLWVFHHLAQEVAEDAAHLAQRVGFLGIAGGGADDLVGVMLAVEHGMEDVGLAGEVPVQGAARNAGIGGDVGHGGVGHALGGEHAFGAVEDLLAGDFGFFFCSAGHRDSHAPVGAVW